MRFAAFLVLALAAAAPLAAAPLPDCTSYTYDVHSGTHLGGIDPNCRFGGLLFTGVTFDDEFLWEDATRPTAYTFNFARVGNRVSVTATPVGAPRWIAPIAHGGFGYSFGVFNLSAFIDPTGPYSAIQSAVVTYGSLEATISAVDPLFYAFVRGYTSGGGGTLTGPGSLVIPGATSGNVLPSPATSALVGHHFQFEYGSGLLDTADPTQYTPPYPPAGVLTYQAGWSATFVLTTTTPEPSTWLMLGTGLLVLGLVGLRRPS